MLQPGSSMLRLLGRLPKERRSHTASHVTCHASSHIRKRVYIDQQTSDLTHDHKRDRRRPTDINDLARHPNANIRQRTVLAHRIAPARAPGAQLELPQLEWR